MTDDVRIPAWAQELRRRIKAGTGSVFLLHFDVSDHVLQGDEFVSLRRFVAWLLKDRTIIAAYNRSSGLRFATPDMEARFRQLSGTEKALLTPEQQAELARLGVEKPEEELPKDPLSVFSLVERALAAMQPGVERLGLLIEYAESIVPSGEIISMNDVDRTNAVTIQRWASDPEISRAGHVFLLAAANLADMHSSLRYSGSRVQSLQIPLPARDERLEYIEYVLGEGSCRLDGMSTEEFANLSAGLSKQHIGTLCQLAASHETPLTLEMLKSWKKEVLEQEFAGMIQVMEPRFGLDAIGGLENVKTFFTEIIDAIKREDINMVPMGITIMGPPGTGKTALIEALAYECGFGFAKIINPREKWVGQSERNYWKAFQALRALAPVVVLEDEADQSEQSRDEYSGDSGVGNRLRQMRFDFTSDPAIRGKVLWIRITNRPDKLDVADKRSGRSSERIPLSMPDAREKALVFAVMPRKHSFACDVQDFSPIVEKTSAKHGDCVSGADIEEISLRAYQNARRRGRNVVSEEDYLWAIEDFIPLQDEETVRFQELLAMSECSSRRFLPAKYREALSSGQLLAELHQIRASRLNK